jgi:nitrile hydratase alpha subunit
MLAKPETACFVIADIAGYTRYLTGVELDHAHDIIADLMDTVVRGLRPPFRLAKFEGDAAFFYAPAEKVDGSLVQDAVEAAYFAFRRRLRDIGQATSCACSACSTMQQLDLKFVAHHGQFVKQRMAGRDELAGRDVILVHRLLKNAVNERLGSHAYALYSDACMRSMGGDPTGQGLVEHGESIEVIGEVTCWVRDLEEAWTAERNRQRSEVTREDAAVVIEFDIAAPRPTVWEYFTVPGQRPKWRGADEVRETPQRGRRGIGTVNHCMHGPDAIVEEVLDWRPFDYLTLTTLLPIPDAPKVLMTYAFLENAGGGTHIEIRVARPKPRDAAFLERVGGEFHKAITSELATLRGMLEGGSGPPAAIDEPALPMHAHDHHDDHDHPDGSRFSEVELRVKALESLLVDKGLVDPAALDRLIDTYERQIGPRNGARIVARAWSDPDYRRRLFADATAAIAELGYGGRQGEDMVALENTPAVHNLVVCTLCSCYPLPVLGLPPVWYKSAPYRSRAVLDPRGVLREFGLELDDSVEVRVWDSTAEVRYLVVPERPAGTEGWSEEALADLVTRDAMIGVGRALAPGSAPASAPGAAPGAATAVAAGVAAGAAGGAATGAGSGSGRSSAERGA